MAYGYFSYVADHISIISSYEVGLNYRENLVWRQPKKDNKAKIPHLNLLSCVNDPGKLFNLQCPSILAWEMKGQYKQI